MLFTSAPPQTPHSPGGRVHLSAGARVRLLSIASQSSSPVLSVLSFCSLLFFFSTTSRCTGCFLFLFFFLLCLACAEAHGAECDHYTHIRTLWRRFFLCHRLGCYGFQCQEKTITKVTEQIKTKKNVCFSGTATCGTVLKFVI